MVKNSCNLINARFVWAYFLIGFLGGLHPQAWSSGALPALKESAPSASKVSELSASTKSEQVFLIQSKESVIKFEAKGRPSFLTILAESLDGPEKEDVSGSVTLRDWNIQKGEIKLFLPSLDTGIKLRNEHMLSYLKTEKSDSDFAVLSLDTQKINSLSETGDGEVVVRGSLLLHGVKKDREFRIQFSNWMATTEFPVVLTQHGIEIPVKMGITVEDVVNVKVQIKFIKK
jgi:hypothetical protein